MLLHQATYPLNLGTKEQPIHIDGLYDEWNPESSQLPASSIASTSLSLPQRPLTTHIPLNSQARTTPREKGRTIVSPFATSSMRKESLAAEPMTAHSQGLPILSEIETFVVKFTSIRQCSIAQTQARRSRRGRPRTSKKVQEIREETP
jgi:hypothetical protein